MFCLWVDVDVVAMLSARLGPRADATAAAAWDLSMPSQRHFLLTASCLSVCSPSQFISHMLTKITDNSPLLEATFSRMAG